MNTSGGDNLKIIEKLTEMIEEEIEDSIKYGKCALKYKEENPKLAEAFYDLSMSELDHMNILHKQTVNIIDEYKRNKSEPSVAMLAIYEYIHNRHIEKVAEAKTLQSMYNGR